MKLGINTLLWTAVVSEADLPLFDRIKAWGFDGIEFPMYTADCSPWAVIAAKLDDLGLGATVCTMANDAANPISDDPAIRQAAVDHFKSCVDATLVLGADLMMGPMYSPVGALVGRPPTRDEWQRGVEVLRAAGEHAQAAGVTFAIESLNRFETYFLNCMADGSRFVDDIGLPNVGLTFDTFHANIEEKDPVAAVRATGHRITHVHCSENDRSTPGQGHVPWKEVFAALKGIGYDRWLTVEAFGRALPEIAAATCIWRDMMESDEQLATDAVKFIRENW